jgi:hypothetical protein
MVTDEANGSDRREPGRAFPRVTWSGIPSLRSEWACRSTYVDLEFDNGRRSPSVNESCAGGEPEDGCREVAGIAKTAELDRLEVLEMVRDTVPNTAIDLADGQWCTQQTVGPLLTLRSSLPRGRSPSLSSVPSSSGKCSGIDQILSLFMCEHAGVPSFRRIALDPARPLTANLFVSYKTGDASS